MTREKLKLIAGVPMPVTLEDATGKPMPSRFHDGVDYLYNVQCKGAACMLYLPVEGVQALQRLGAQSGDEIEIVKTHVNGTRPTFKVYRLTSDAQEPVRGRHSEDVPPYYAPERMPVGRASEAPVEGIRMLAPRQQAAPQPRPMPSAQSMPSAQTIPTVHPLQERMTRMFVTAATSLRDAHQQIAGADPLYADLGCPTWEDIRATAIHWAIGLEKREGR